MKALLKDTLPLYLTCLHLNHVSEPRRLIEINALHDHLKDIFEEGHCQIWTGDFNALTQEDYSHDELARVTLVRQRNSWELPKYELTDKVKAFGFKDTWQLAGCPKPIKTCRFDTHIDYVYANDKLLSHYNVHQVAHVDDSASDHNMVKTVFNLKA